MLLKTCLACEHHEIRRPEGIAMSHCGKENCWARYSKCVMFRALDRFLDEEAVGCSATSPGKMTVRPEVM